MTYFETSSTLPTEHIDRTANAYKLAGLTPPNQAHHVTETLGAIPDYATELNNVAREALETTDPTEFIEQAISRIQRAKAADELRAALPRVLDALEQETAPERITRTAADLAPFLAKTIKTLTQAAAKLDRTDPLNIENAVRDDTTKELKTAQAALYTLARILETYPTRQDHRVPYQVMRLLPLVTLPNVGPSKYIPTHGYAHNIDDEGSPVREALQRLVRDVTDNIDLTVIKLANGGYAGLSFTLATADELDARVEAAAAAYSQVAVENPGAVTIRR